MGVHRWYDGAIKRKQPKGRKAWYNMNTATLKRKYNRRFHEIINEYDNEDYDRNTALKLMQHNVKECKALMIALVECDSITREEYMKLDDWLAESHKLYQERL